MTVVLSALDAHFLSCRFKPALGFFSKNVEKPNNMKPLSWHRECIWLFSFTDHQHSDPNKNILSLFNNLKRGPLPVHSSFSSSSSAMAELAFLFLNCLIFCKVVINDVTLELLEYGKNTIILVM